MRLLLKFNLIFLLVLGAGIAVTAVLAQRYLRSAAREEVFQEARLMMETISATRTYTTKQVRPPLEILQKRDKTFYAQTVPAFGAQQIFGYLHADFRDYSYREATLNPTNPSDRAVDWEADVVNYFRNDRSQREVSGERDTPTGRSLYFAKPLVATEACLECHSVPKAAPPPMVKIYGTNNGFGWKPNEIVAAQIISVPMSRPLAAAAEAFRTIIVWMIGISVAVLLLLNIALYFAVVRPVTAMSRAADEISRGNLNVPELPVKGKDEISRLADAFNRMHRSLAKAMKLLEDNASA
jgi:protein-histidine pros-kinase